MHGRGCGGLAAGQRRPCDGPDGASRRGHRASAGGVHLPRLPVAVADQKLVHTAGGTALNPQARAHDTPDKAQ